MIKEVVYKHLMGIIKRLKEGNRFRNELVKRFQQQYSKSNSGEIKKTEARLKQLIKIASKLYEDFAADLINERTYKELLLKNKQEQDLLELKLKTLTNQEQQLKDKISDLDKLINKFNDYLDNLELTAEIVNSLIERIELSYPEIIDGVKCRKVKIIYKFIAESIDLD